MFWNGVHIWPETTGQPPNNDCPNEQDRCCTKAHDHYTEAYIKGHADGNKTTHMVSGNDGGMRHIITTDARKPNQ